MNLSQEKYNRYALCREMMDAADVVRHFDTSVVAPFLPSLKGVKKILFTGEGSSRIFPAKRALAEERRFPGKHELFTEGSTQAMEYDLTGTAVFGASNSGKTKELLRLIYQLEEDQDCITGPIFGLTANAGTPLTEAADLSHVLSCGSEDAVAATKSVVEQALFYQALLWELKSETLVGFSSAADQMKTVLKLPVESSWIEKLVNAPRIYFAGRNDGVSEELTLKINEITRKPSAFLEGTYALHGIEEVMNPDEVLILVNPFVDEEQMYQRRLVEGVGMTVLAIADRPTPFPTLQIPAGGAFSEYLQLAAGWNLMVEVGLAAGVNLDKPVRARKVGNEF
jgi:glucosamine--fructose-6-phosphate aminotransferase (isomerizing)